MYIYIYLSFGIEYFLKGVGWLYMFFFILKRLPWAFWRGWDWGWFWFFAEELGVFYWGFWKWSRSKSLTPIEKMKGSLVMRKSLDQKVVQIKKISQSFFLSNTITISLRYQDLPVFTHSQKISQTLTFTKIPSQSLFTITYLGFRLFNHSATTPKNHQHTLTKPKNRHHSPHFRSF